MSAVNSEFIEQAKELFPEYNYDKVEYINNSTKVEIVCPKHGSFLRRPNTLLSAKRGCPSCLKESKDVPWTEQEFLEKAHNKFGNKFDYSMMRYTSKSGLITIICSEHGEIVITPTRHISSKAGCSKCAGVAKKTTKEFVEEASALFPQYDYSEVVYKSCRTKVKVICPEHGAFYINPKEHVGNRKIKCRLCTLKDSKYKQETSEQYYMEKLFDARPEFIEKFDYSFMFYINDKTPITVRCKEHDYKFDVQPRTHKSSKLGGCPHCLSEIQKRRGELTKYTSEQFIENSIKLFGDKFDYSAVKYTGCRENINLKCNTCGSAFETNPMLHLKAEHGGCYKCAEDSSNRRHSIESLQKVCDEKLGEGLYDLSGIKDYVGINNMYEFTCNSCGNTIRRNLTAFIYSGGSCDCQKEVYTKSSMERIVESLLLEREIPFVDEKSFDGCRYKNPLRFDFYIPSEKIAIECQGQQHYMPVEFFGGEENFKQSQIRDNIKKAFCEKEGIKLLEIRYDTSSEEEIKKLLEEHLYKIPL